MKPGNLVGEMLTHGEPWLVRNFISLGGGLAGGRRVRRKRRSSKNPAVSFPRAVSVSQQKDWSRSFLVAPDSIVPDNSFVAGFHSSKKSGLASSRRKWTEPEMDRGRIIAWTRCSLVDVLYLFLLAPTNYTRCFRFTLIRLSFVYVEWWKRLQDFKGSC